MQGLRTLETGHLEATLRPTHACKVGNVVKLRAGLSFARFQRPSQLPLHCSRLRAYAPLEFDFSFFYITKGTVSKPVPTYEQHYLFPTLVRVEHYSTCTRLRKEEIKVTRFR